MAGPRRLVGRIGAAMPRAAIRDPLEQQKRERQRQQQTRLRSRRRRTPTTTSAPSLRERLDALFSDELHPWWSHLPAEQQTRQHRFTLIRRRLQAWLKRKPQRIGLTVITYAFLCSLPLLWGLPLISLVALLPLLLVPPLGLLVYWLVWKEFHA